MPEENDAAGMPLRIEKRRSSAPGRFSRDPELDQDDEDEEEGILKYAGEKNSEV